MGYGASLVDGEHARDPIMITVFDTVSAVAMKRGAVTPGNRRAARRAASVKSKAPDQRQQLNSSSVREEDADRFSCGDLVDDPKWRGF
jgi:hypothetical protein